MLNDLLGVELKVGMRVARAVRYGNRAAMEIRTITHVEDSHLFLNESSVRFYNAHTLLVIPDTYPIEVR